MESIFSFFFITIEKKYVFITCLDFTASTFKIPTKREIKVYYTVFHDVTFEIRPIR